MTVHVRAERADDVAQVDAVVEAAFESRLEADLVNALRRSAHPQLSLVAEADGAVVGHIFFSPATIEGDQPAPPACLLAPVAGIKLRRVCFQKYTRRIFRAYFPRPAPLACLLAPVAVLPNCQRSGVGSTLIRAGLADCRALGWSAVFLVGDPAYYSRFGFELAGARGFAYPGPHDRFLQCLELEAGSLSGFSGRIRLHKAFAEVGAE